MIFSGSGSQARTEIPARERMTRARIQFGMRIL
jgi:hypothetical protein